MTRTQTVDPANDVTAAPSVRPDLHRSALPIPSPGHDAGGSLLRSRPPSSMHRFWALPLRRQLFLAILLLLVPVLSAAIWSGLSSYRERLNELGDQTRV